MDKSELVNRVLRIPEAQLDPGRNKYVMVVVELDGKPIRTFVRSREAADLHYKVAIPLETQLLEAGVTPEDIKIPGGGRIKYNPKTKRVKIYGYSNQFGQADHDQAADIVRRCMDCAVEVSYEGY